jgi:hypothetical protein
MVGTLEILWERKVQNNAYTLHGDTKIKEKAHGVVPWARSKSDSSCYLLQYATCRAGSDTGARGR